MRKLVVFNSITLDGYFSGKGGDISWAHRPRDAEFDGFVAHNAKGGGVFVFGRVTYELMMNYWPTPKAMKRDPVVAERMNNLPKVVFSKTLGKVEWNNTRLVKGDPVAELQKMKKTTGNDLAIMGSGSLVAQLASKGVIDEYQVVVIPIVLGQGKTMFEGIEKKVPLKLTNTRAFDNGNVLLTYEPEG